MSVQPRCGFAQPLGERLGRARGQPRDFGARRERATAQQGRRMLDVGERDGERVLGIEAPSIRSSTPGGSSVPLLCT